MRYLPIFLDVQTQPVLVVGGGEVAARKANLLLEAGARVTVVSPVLGPTLSRMVQSGLVEHINAAFEPAHLGAYRLVIAATDDATVNRQVADLAEARQLPVNVADQQDR